ENVLGSSGRPEKGLGPRDAGRVGLLGASTLARGQGQDHNPQQAQRGQRTRNHEILLDGNTGELEVGSDGMLAHLVRWRPRQGPESSSASALGFAARKREK